jgi:hypothetical protein
LRLNPEPGGDLTLGYKTEIPSAGLAPVIVMVCMLPTITHVALVQLKVVSLPPIEDLRQTLLR